MIEEGELWVWVAELLLITNPTNVSITDRTSGGGAGARAMGISLGRMKIDGV